MGLKCCVEVLMYESVDVGSVIGAQGFLTSTH